ncbi:MAG: NUDIX domain-containing protein [Candidatus Diapherotrites archaeon]|nr:NUDIX domain-containing protein [Candidatus Diapherotrites archaeon]
MEYPEPTVGALIVNRNKEILLMEQALRREVREEVGIEIEEPHFIMFHELIYPREFLYKKHFISFHFLCRQK